MIIPILLIVVIFMMFSSSLKAQGISTSVNNPNKNLTFQSNVTPFYQVARLQDSSSVWFVAPSFQLRGIGYQRSDINPTGGLLWTDDSGYVKRTLMNTLRFTQSNITGLTDTLTKIKDTLSSKASVVTVAAMIAASSYAAGAGLTESPSHTFNVDGTIYKTKAQNDVLYQAIGSYLTSEVDPTVPVYSKTLSAFSVIKTSTDALYYPLSGNPSAFLTSYTETDPLFNSKFSAKTTSDLTEGSNLYYTPARFNTAFSGKTTTDLVEGTNLYWTPARFTTALTSGAIGTALGYTPLSSSLNSAQILVGNGSNVATGVSPSGDFTLSNTGIATLANSGVTAGTYMGATFNTKGLATAGTNPTVDTLSSARTFNTTYLMSSTRYTDVRMSAQISCTLSLSGGQSGTIFLETSPDASTWTQVGQLNNSSTGSLTIGLNTTSIGGSQLTTLVPPTYFWRARTANNTGTPTFTMIQGSKITY